ncbi:hypothetical protein H920_16575 [Fukomys damarensis]|uniref:Uncharacterized protein n=1 Tax=Fukomys damarensis TaxID=885580 RepID=A0A091CU83_FUKDA|nr:hypothetical protein H920_16575 [Fukomys damarensis]
MRSLIQPFRLRSAGRISQWNLFKDLGLFLEEEEEEEEGEEKEEPRWRKPGQDYAGAVVLLLLSTFPAHCSLVRSPNRCSFAVEQCHSEVTDVTVVQFTVVDELMVKLN